MSHGTAFDSYNSGLVNGINDLVSKRNALQNIIQKQQESRISLQNDIRLSLKKLKDLEDNLDKNVQLRHEYEVKISDSERTYLKILECSHDLLANIKSGSMDYEYDISK